MSYKHQIHPLHPAIDSIVDDRPPIAITRTRSGQRMWSDPVLKAQRDELAHLRPFAATPILFHNPYHDIASNRTVISTSAAPIAAAVCRDIPLRTLPSAYTAHYRNGSINYSRYNNNIINSIHDRDLYEDSHLEYDAYAVQPAPRIMRQAPKLLTLDDYNLISLGYKPVMSRRLPWVSLSGIAITAANVFGGVIPLYGLTVTNGGPAWATWSYLIVGLMSIIVTLCLSELASAYPTTAGVHHWVYQLGSARRRAFISWMVGWFTIVSTVTVTASLAFYFSAVLGQLLLSIHRTALTPATLVMFHLGVLFGWQLFNLIPIRALGYLSIASGLFIVGLAVALISAMLSMAEFGPSMSHIPFTAFLNYSGSSSAVYAALSSTLMASFVFCPQDTIIRMAEESRRPERTMGKLMVVSSLSTLLAGLPLVIVLNYGTIKPIKGLLDEMVPSIRVITETLGKVTGAVFVILVLVAMFSTGVIRLAAASRTVYSFARDGGLPRSSYWNHLHPSRKTPQRVSWLVTAACMCCIFPFFWGNSVAFHWISSLGCISANICYATPLWMRLTHEGSLHFIPGNFTLGRFSRPLHIISIIWLLLLSLFLMLPPTYPITKNNFNYAPVVMTILGLLFGISWFKARTDFTGGAKDVSRASHQIPSDTYKDIYPMKPQSRAQSQYYHEGSLESESRSMGSSHHKQPTHTTMQKAKNYSTLDKSRYAYAHNFGTNQPPTSRFESLQQQKQQQRRQQISLTPPRRGPVIVNKKQQHQQLQPDNSTLRSPSSNFTSQLGQCSPVTNLTMNSITSIQSHPSSILGLLLSESPEMMSSELVVRNSSPPSPPFAVTTTATNASVSQKAVAPTPESSTASSLLLTKPLGTLSGVPVTSVDPLVPKCSSKTSYSLGKGTVANKGSQAFKVSSNYSNAAAGKSKAKPPPISPPIIKIHHLDSETSNSSSSTPSELLTARPLSVNDSIFKLGMGLTSKLTEKKSYTGQENPSNSEFHRSRKGRAPTPYPSSLADADESGAHSYYTNSAMMDDPYPFQSGRTLSTQRNSYNSFGEKGQRPITETGEYSIEEIVSAMDISTSSSMINQQFISQFPTLDGYPLLKSPSTMGGDGNSSVGGNSYERSASLNLPTVLPLSRTHTIQQSEYGYGASFKLRDSDEGSEELTKRGILSEPDDSYDEGYNRNYPLIPISKSRLHALTPLSSTSGFFRLPNRDISITVNGTRKSIGDATARPPRSQPLSTMEGHHDPIERLLLLSQHSHQQQQQSQEQISNVSNVDPVQQQLQRTRSVANWAQEQALIQEKRTKHKARVRALKELRKYDPTATLSINSSDSSFSTLFSDLSENTPSSESWSLTQSQNQSRSSSVGAGVGVGGSSVKKLERFRKQQQMSGANNGKLQSLKEGEPLELSRLELVVRAQEEEEEPGIYIDTDDVLSPIVEVESVGAGVGRPSFRT